MIVGNTVPNPASFGDAEGGGIFCDEVQLTISGTTLDGNAAREGSSLYYEGENSASRDHVIIERCRILNGEGGHPDFYYGMYILKAASLNMSDTEVSGHDNRSMSFFNSDALLVDRSLFHHNAGGVAMRILSTNDNVFLNTTFYRNYALEGAAIYAENNSTFQLVNCTLVDDSLTSSGSDGREIHLENSTVLLKNTVIAETFFHGSDAFGGSNPAAISSGGNVCNDMSLDAVLTQPNDASNINPQLGAFDNHGGLTKTWSLATGSTCIDRGGSDTLTVDQRRYFRDALVDAGAYEFDGLNTAVEFVPEVSDLIVYPQPFSEQLTVQWTDMEVQQINVLDLHGRTLRTFSVVQQGTQVLNLRSTPTGMYVVQLSSGTGGSVVRRVMKVD